MRHRNVNFRERTLDQYFRYIFEEYHTFCSTIHHPLPSSFRASTSNSQIKPHKTHEPTKPQNLYIITRRTNKTHQNGRCSLLHPISPPNHRPDNHGRDQRNRQHPHGHHQRRGLLPQHHRRLPDLPALRRRPETHHGRHNRHTAWLWTP